MAKLLLGPLLRYVGETAATVWVETDAACEVGVLGASTRTFCVDGHHYALVVVSELEPGSAYEYGVDLDGERAWPDPGSGFPPSVIRTLGDEEELRLAFGSCRVALPHELPFVLDQHEDARGHGVDALRTLALGMRDTPAAGWPHMLLMLGDQIYADELSPGMREVTGSRDDATDAPHDELARYSEYALAYREAWGEPVLRWLLSTVPTAMVFDDHEIHAQWKLSEPWQEGMRGHSWYERRIENGLAAYWVYQHLGNLSPEELERNELLRRVRAEPDAGRLLREFARTADHQPGHSRWSYSRDLGHARLVVIDSRAGRELGPGRRAMIDPGEWEWVAEQAAGDRAHLVLASSVPFFLGHGLHYAEAVAEALADGALGGLAARAGERARQSGVMDHWAAFQRSFRGLAALLEDVAAGRRGAPPASIVMLSGDVHHCYLAEVGFHADAAARSPVWQAVCSAYRKGLSPGETRAMRIGNSALAARIMRSLARAVGIARERVGWRLVEEPSYGNQVGLLTLAPDRARVRIETTAGCDWREPHLRELFERRLAGSRGRGPGTEAAEDTLEVPG